MFGWVGWYGVVGFCLVVLCCQGCWWNSGGGLGLQVYYCKVDEDQVEYGGYVQ